MVPNRLFVACGKSSLPPDMVVGKKQKVFYCFFPHVNSDWIAKEQVLSGSRPSRGISHSGLSRNAAPRRRRGVQLRRAVAALRSPLVVSSVNG